jgi:hypothetical protein
VLVALLAVLAVDAVVTGVLLEVEPVAVAGAVALAATYALLGVRVLTSAVRAVRAAPVGI